MKKAAISNLIFNVISLLLLFVILSYNGYYLHMNSVSNNFLSEDSRRFSSDTFSDHIHLKGFYFAHSLDEYIIREEHSAELPIGVIAKNYLPPFELNDGRFFRNYDFFNKQKVAVVGYNYAQAVGGYIPINGSYYRIIGIIRNYANGNTNNMILYNLDSAENTMNVFSIDSNSPSMIDKVFTALVKSARANEIYNEDISLDRLTGNQSNNKMMYSLVVSLVCVIQLVKVLFAIRDNAKRIRIQYLFGKMKNSILRYVALKVVLESAIAFVIALCLLLFTDNYVRWAGFLFDSSILLLSASFIEIVMSPIQIYNFMKYKKIPIFKRKLLGGREHRI